MAGAKSKGIVYKDTLAMPGSNLHELLTKGDAKKAEQCYQETETRYRKSMGMSQEKKDATKTQTSPPVV
jgi:hypothetical protein